MTRLLRVAFLVALAILAYPTPALAEIGPYSVEITTPPNVRAGEAFEVGISATNGGESVPRWSISLSLPDGGTAQVVSPAPFTQGESYAKVFPPGGKIYNFQLGQTVSASYPLAELYRQEDWPTGANRSLRVRVTAPTDKANVRVFIRITLRDSHGTFVSFPQTSSDTDQQSYPVLVKSVPIAAAAPTATRTAVTRTPTPASSPAAARTDSLPATTTPPTSSPTQPAVTLTPRPTAAPTSSRPPVVGPAGTAVATATRLAPTPATGTAGQSSTLTFILALAGLFGAAGLVTLYTAWRSRRSPAAVANGVESVEAVAEPPRSRPDQTAAYRPVSPVLTTDPPTIAFAPVGAFPAGFVRRGAARSGGMSDVYRAYQPALDRDVALKMPRPGLAADPAFAERFRDEARRTARLNHPNIITIFDVGEVAGTPYIVMRYVDGPSVADLLAKQGSLPPGRSIGILEQVARALDYAHGQGIVHGDVKPSNILLEEEDRATLTDFGIARAAGPAEAAGSGGVVGTPDYVSPEQARGEASSAGGDVYSLGVVAYELLVGRKPFNAESPLALLYAHAYSSPPPPDQVNSSLSSAVASVLLRALAKDPARRYPTAGAFVQALRQAMGL